MCLRFEVTSKRIDRNDLPKQWMRDFCGHISTWYNPCLPCGISASSEIDTTYQASNDQSSCLSDISCASDMHCPWEWGGRDWTSRSQQVQVERYRLPCHDPIHWHTNRMAIVKRVLCACCNWALDGYPGKGTGNFAYLILSVVIFAWAFHRRYSPTKIQQLFQTLFNTLAVRINVQFVCANKYCWGRNPEIN